MTAVPASPQARGGNRAFAATPRGGGDGDTVVEVPLFGRGRVVRTRPADGCQVVELVGWRLAGGSKALLYRFPGAQ